MYLLMSAAASVLFLALYLFKRRKNVKDSGAACVSIMFFSAALMWCVDGFFSALEGEGFFDFSAEAFSLGLIIVASGVAVYIALSVLAKFKAKRAEKA